ncbi:hypothetical protein [Conexibacter woesei]|uniref:hypothetical protein n=1 Tax=Conexibacter woesei TaxID=191495 RepID=UPI0011D29D8F|nr:hypothetical protein [Conexibacter woesei]
MGIALSMALALMLAAAVSSAGATPLLSCPVGNSAGTFTPPLTNTPQPVGVTYTDNYGPCVGLSGVRTGTMTRTAPPAPRTCTSLLGGTMNVPLTIAWSTGTTSDVIVDSYPQLLTGGVVELTLIGDVTGGDFAGGHIVVVDLVVGATPLACSTTGVASSSGLATLTITP